MSQWYSKFIKNYADLCEPLYNLKKKFKKFCWSVEAQRAFDVVKTAITEAPILKLPDFEKPFELFTDASSIGIGAVLNQEQRPVVYASRTLSSAERNYTVTERECANRTERVNRYLVQMIANYVNDQHDTWDQFLLEFAYAIRTAVNETTGKTPAELFLGRKLITPFQKLVMVSDGTEFAVGDTEKLFDEARRNSKVKHEKWAKYYNRRRRDVCSDWSWRDETVVPSTSGYNLRPRRDAKMEFRPANEKRTQQGGPVRARGSKDKQQYRSYTEEQRRSRNSGIPEAEVVNNSIARRGKKERTVKTPTPLKY
ncbi:retrovirus-related Pol polyprotein from transposon 297 [Trichonephila clavipes]|nr:retrovirus-related Pol polyprotein from transposon 297 [Trichonephila clavipes]